MPLARNIGLRAFGGYFFAQRYGPPNVRPNGRSVTISYAKPPLTRAQQLSHLAARGLIIADQAGALAALTRISYYRLSGYWHWLRDPSTNGFRRGASFEEALRLYEFDRRLRLVVLAGIERVEVHARAAVTDVLAHRYGPFAHAVAGHFKGSFKHQEWTTKLDAETSRASEDFLQHYRKKYSGFPKIPIWMATEIVSFGSLSFLLGGMENADVMDVGTQLGVHGSLVRSWVHTLFSVRNVCAHHGRLWNRELGVQPMIPNSDPTWAGIRPRRVYSVLRILNQLTRPIDRGAWWAEVSILLAETNVHPAMQQAMGLPTDWATRPMQP